MQCYTASVFDLEKALTVATAAAKAAGKILEDHFQKPLTIKTKSSARDLVTEVDGLAQETIIETIFQKYPDHGFITEEVVGPRHAVPLQKNASSPYKWIIDPLDGTTNFTRGKKECGTIIALQENDELVLGVMWLPFLGHLYTGAKGKGTFLNGKQIHLRKTANMIDAILCTNLIARAKEDAAGVLQISIPPCAFIHNYGCAAEEIGAVLRGENDGVFFDGVGLWDIAAGCVLLAEAGGKYCYTFKEHVDPAKGVLCVASTAPIFGELHNFLFPGGSPQNGTHTR